MRQNGHPKNTSCNTLAWEQRVGSGIPVSRGTLEQLLKTAQDLGIDSAAAEKSLGVSFSDEGISFGVLGA